MEDKVLNKLNNLLNCSYSPYSKCKVACVIDFGNSYEFACGVNVENASYGLTNCAERSAIFNAVSMGYDLSKAERLYIKSNQESFFTPCGACLQVMSEFFSGDLKVVVINSKDEVKEFKFNELLPLCFDKSKLKSN